VVTVIGLSYILGEKTAHMFLDVSVDIVLILHLLICFSLDNEFTQLMKGLQGERLRQAFKYLDKDQDGFIRPEEFKQIILVCKPFFRDPPFLYFPSDRKLLGINYLMQSLNVYLRSARSLLVGVYLILRSLHFKMLFEVSFIVLRPGSNPNFCITEMDMVER
jgi:hypothetical protein